MSFSHGKDSVFKLAGTDISAYTKKVSFKPSAQASETTTMGNQSKTFIGGMKDGSIQVDYEFDPALLTILLAARGASSAFEYGPQGTANGKVKLTGNAILTDMPFDFDVANPGSGSFSLQITGDITAGVYP